MSETLKPKLTEAEQRYFDTGGREAPPGVEPTAPKPPPAFVPAGDPKPATAKTPAPSAPPERAPIVAPGTAAPPPAQRQAGEEDDENASIPLARLIEERKHRQEAERQRQVEREQWIAEKARYQAQLEQLQPRQSEPPPPPPIPEFGANPEQFIKRNFETTEQKIARLEAYQQQVEAEKQAGALDRWAWQQGESVVRADGSKVDDYRDAERHLGNMRINHLVRLGHTPDQAQNMLRIEALQIAAAARQNGQFLPAIIYDLAIAAGYQPKDAADAAEAAPEPQAPREQFSGPSRAVSASQFATPDPAAVAKLESVERAQRSAGGFGGTSGGPPPAGKVTAAKIMQMLDSNPKEGIRLAMQTSEGKRILSGERPR